MFASQAIKSVFGRRNVVVQISRVLYSSKDEGKEERDMYQPRRPRELKDTDVRVCIAGGAGNVGTKLGLLLKTSPMIDALTMYDIEEHIYGVAVDLSHIDSKCKVFQFRKRARLEEALAGAGIVIICASGRRNLTTTEDEMFDVNAEAVEEIATATANICPQAFVLVVSQPVDSLTPLVGQVFRDANLNSRQQVIGVTSANVMRATRILAESLHCNPTDIIVPVIGGHSEKTIVPVYSACMPMTGVNDPMEIDLCQKMLALYKSGDPSEQMVRVISNMVYLVKNWDTWVHGSNPYNHSATITGAMSAYRTTINLVTALRSNKFVVDSAYVETDVVPGLSYSTVPLKFGPNGVHECFNVPMVTQAEKDMLEEAIKHLLPAVTKGRQFAVKSLLNRTLGLSFTP